MSASALRPNLATIPPHLPFLDALAPWWLHQVGGDPAAVAEAIFVLPTRRAARGLADAFLYASAGQALLLPRILALGAVDEAPFLLAGALDLPPAISPLRRLAVLARFILAMNGAHGAPREPDRAWELAAELASLLDEAARAEIDLATALPGAAGEDFAAHWQVTLNFLHIVTRAWPAWLADQGLADVAARQIALIDAQSAAWRAAPPPTPVIAAGTTGAIPAVARLLRLVAHLPAGLVVLPGLDHGLDATSWDALDATHPQASLRGLLHAMQATRGDVRDWRQIAAALPPDVCVASRVETWRIALLPAAALGLWQSPPPLATEGLARLEAADQQEEAVSIALVLRDALSAPHARAALVTPDRALARRVAAELLRFGIIADDSAGEPLAHTPAAVFLLLLAEAVADQLRPVPLLALLKHPLCAAGMHPASCRAAARQLEKDCLRGPRPAPGIEGLRQRQADAHFVGRLSLCLRPLLDLAEPIATSPDRVLLALLEAAEALAATDTEAGADRLWAGEDGQALAEHLAELAEALKVLPPIRLAALPALLGATLTGIAVRTRRALRGRDGTEHPRLHIWGLLEARLQSADLIVLGGLCEGTWPPGVESGPWMNRAMRAAIGLPSPEERIGLAAHDFVMAACSARTAILSAPRRREGAPAVPARWLVRLDALLEGRRLRLERHPAPAWSRLLDRPDGPPAPVSPPAPAPPVALRPRRLNVTEIETWMRDPYAIHARHVLQLRPLDPLEQSADAADYGRIVHEGLNRFCRRCGLAWPADAAAQLAADMDAALAERGMRPALAAWWRPRLRRIAAWVAVAERDRRLAGPPQAIRPEVPGSWMFPAPAGPFTLQGRADRIERRADGRVAILDYKTGTPPSAKSVEDGRSPQLPLEAAMVAAGAFGRECTGEVAELVYWHITGGHEPGRVVCLFKGEQAKIEAVVAQAESALQRLVAAFDQPSRAYLSQPSPGAAPRFSDYARLARVAEWASAEDAEPNAGA